MEIEENRYKDISQKTPKVIRREWLKT